MGARQHTSSAYSLLSLSNNNRISSVTSEAVFAGGSCETAAPADGTTLADVSFDDDTDAAFARPAAVRTSPLRDRSTASLWGGGASTSSN
jgi:hypothetical protein